MIKKYTPKFSEEVYLKELQLSDLSSNQGASSFSMNFQKERGRVNGSETRNSFLLECNLIPGGHADFVWLSEGTNKYPDDYKYQVSKRKNNYRLTPDPSHTYTITLRVLNVKDWLSTYPNKTKISKNDILDILEVSDVEIDTDCAAWYWQSGAYSLQQLGGTIRKRKIKAPQFWNNPKYHGDGNFFLDKITQRIINQYKFYSQQMAQMLTSQAKKRKWIK
jgi:hypothetical protein